MGVDTANEPASTGLTGATAAMNGSAEAGPSVVQPVKRKYEVDAADREWCKKVCLVELPKKHC
jgi:hypothetical protein